MIYKKSHFVTVLILFTVVVGLHAQQDAQYTQYMYNTMSVNPAYAGSRGQLSIAALYRSQWVGLEGAPKSQTLNLHSPIRNSRLGYGISIVNDNIGNGVVKETQDRKSTRLNSSHVRISYAVFCLKKKNIHSVI